ncbi:3-deoxy-7-phosphoheptulonate synthase [Pseudonocardiaceae bacterium YIM PH 21723]|nr:3-deoxy-7-phosphoheptulonate synthase [Pseudonocardiaceae bacterium YIM PH 21723]
MVDKVLVFDPAVTDEQIQAWQHHLKLTNGRSTTRRLGPNPVLVVPAAPQGTAVSDQLPVPLREIALTGEIRLSDRSLRPEGTIVRIGPAIIGDGAVNVFAGPCAVETWEQLIATATAVAQCGVIGLRGGAFKPRTSPYSFQGLQWAGLDLLAKARERTGLPVLTEVVEPDHVGRVAATADALQIGARNMQNFSLLTAAGKSGKPVVLKRGFGATIDETLGAAEYLLNQGNDQVIICERGIRTFENATRFTLDLSAVAVFKQRSHLPVMVDPSHAAGIPALIEPLSLAAAAVGADALLIDVHVRPEQALCDGKQAMLPRDFATLMGKLEVLAMGAGRKMGSVPQPDVEELMAQNPV